MEAAFEKQGYPVLECGRCRHRFLGHPAPVDHVERTFGDHYFHGGGAGYPDYLAEGWLLRRRGGRYARLVEAWRPPGTVLDVGAAAGFLLQGFTERGWTGRGVEPNAAMARHARDRGLQVEVGTLEDLPAEPVYDVVLMVQVVAHVYDLRCAFRSAAAATAPGGYWLVETWDWTTWLARLFGDGWHEYSPPSVRHWFSTQSLVRVASDVGFCEVARGRPSKWIAAAHAASLLAHALGPSRLGRAVGSLGRRMPGRLAVPYPAADLLWMLLRKK